MSLQNPHPQQKQLDAFRIDIQAEVDKAFNPHPTTYRKVVVQFISFTQTDNPGIAKLEQDLGKVFRDLYNFDVRFSKSSTSAKPNATIELADTATQLSKECGGDSLLVLVYSGHGRTDTVQGQPVLTMA
jgi:hypothetical protein